MNRLAQIPAVLLPLALLAGCVQENARITNGTSNNTLPIFTNAPVGDVTARAPDAPSTTSLNRSSWATTDFIVEPDGLRTRYSYADNSIAFNDSARQRGDPPTPRSALEMNTTKRGDLYEEAFLSPVYALGDLVMMPWRMYKHSPSRAQRINPSMSYWRAPTSDASLANATATRLLVETNSKPPAPAAPNPAHEPDAEVPMTPIDPMPE